MCQGYYPHPSVVNNIIQSPSLPLYVGSALEGEQLDSVGWLPGKEQLRQSVRGFNLMGIPFKRVSVSASPPSARCRLPV